MKLSLLLMAMPIAIYAQDTISVKTPTTGYPDPYTSGSAYVEPFDNSARLFRDWSISLGGGTALIQSADLTSPYGNKFNWGWNAYASLDKQINHLFGLSLQYQQGETHQKGKLSFLPNPGVASTKYNQVAVIGDMNFSNLLRIVDNNHGEFKWAIHGYAGVGLQGFKTTMTDANGPFIVDGKKLNYTKYPFNFTQKIGLDSFFYEIGSGLKYNASKYVDVEARLMYIITGDETFDGGGWRREGEPYNQLHNSGSDNFLTATLGLSIKLGKNPTALKWYDPLRNAYGRTERLLQTDTNLVVCEKGDKDNDGVCDDWDRQLDTPVGARVDGAGVALDMDMDGVIDLYDKCVTVPGPVENNGCPTAAAINPSTVYEQISSDLEGIEFELNSDKIRPTSYSKLNHAAEIIKTLGTANTFAVVGATDTRGSEQANQTLSQKRANAVVKYLTEQGVASSILVAEGHGEKDLKYPECDPATKCPEWKNEANRRVYFKQK